MTALEKFNLMMAVFFSLRFSFPPTQLTFFRLLLTDVARLMIQCLHSMVSLPSIFCKTESPRLTPPQGLSKSASCLEEECGMKVEEDHILTLRRCVLGGDWKGALGSLDGLEVHQENHLRIKYIILRQKYFERLEVANSLCVFLYFFLTLVLQSGSKLEAIECLRNEISPLLLQTVFEFFSFSLSPL